MRHMELVTIVFAHIDSVKDDFSNLSFLLDEDYEYLKKFIPLETKKERAISQYFKRKYIGQYYVSEYGKPMSKNTYFNISHSHGLVVIAIAKKEVGIDIELVREAEENIRSFISSEEEYLYIKDNASFYEIWTSKESLTKALGSGINIDIKKIPALPINGHKTYFCRDFYTKCFNYKNYKVSISLNSNEDFEVIEKEEVL